MLKTWSLVTEVNILGTSKLIIHLGGTAPKAVGLQRAVPRGLWFLRRFAA